MNNFQEIKKHLNTHATTYNLSWQENKQKASIKIINYIDNILKQFNIDHKNDTFETKNIKFRNKEKIKNTFLYVLDMLQKSINECNFSIEKFDEIKDDLSKQLYLNLTGQSIQNDNTPIDNMLIKSLSEKESKTLLKNLKIIVTHKNTDWNNSNTKTNWFSKNTYNNRTKTHEDFRKFANNNFMYSGMNFKNLSLGLKYIGGVGYHKAKSIEKLIGLDKDYIYI